MELKTNNLSALKETITNETMNLLYSTFDLNFGHNENVNTKQMPLAQLKEFTTQSYQSKYDVEITFTNNIALTGQLVSKKDENTFIFNTNGNIFRILKLDDIKYIKLAN
ncbi:hypothetical protein RD055328_04820 [Companilactobacillus sp. RD055328]|uniref:hypothetical protein n=1 Tax=Companilactobacillus sp. RD055328 TaxID=2916634 RepID=UPI001FC7D25B|nr:hypothetical protein [Companilactobacillus sp. RD055328]GKQ42559.1 hypothetical protein RD055328_04820 [Companilactobacillus sp. RD055328]